MVSESNETGTLRAPITGLLRSWLWGLVLAFTTDGISWKKIGYENVKIKQLLPNKPTIVVANHQSHADSVLINSIIGRERKLIFVAGKEYWGSKWYRALAGRILMGIHPINKGARGWEELLALKPLILNGAVVVIYPEGTRSIDGEVGEFKTGAFRLAKECGAVIQPITLNGTGKLLPKNGKISRTSLELKLGEVITSIDDPESLAKKAREEIIRLRSEDVTKEFPGKTWFRVSKLSAGYAGLAFVFSWAFAEAFSWPFTAELPLILLASVAPTLKRAGVLSVFAAMGSILGVYIHWFFASKGVSFYTPLTTDRMYQRAVEDWKNPAYAGVSQMWNGVPVKVYAKSAGEAMLSISDVTLALVARGFRIITVGLLANIIGRKISRYLKPSLGVIQIFALQIYAIGLYLVIRYWS